MDSGAWDEIAGEFGFDFLDGGQAAAEFFGQGFGEMGLPGGDGVGFEFGSPEHCGSILTHTNAFTCATAADARPVGL